jgi:hypothetical protein
MELKQKILVRIFAASCAVLCVFLLVVLYLASETLPDASVSESPTAESE